MQKCTIYHTGVSQSANGVIKENKVYLQGNNNELSFPENMFMAREECENALIQFQVEGKWGFADISTGEIMIDPLWDYAGPFYNGFAHVALGVKLDAQGNYINIEGGKHGYINIDGEVIIPLIYDAAAEIPYRNYFTVIKNGKNGLIDSQNKTIIPLKWDFLETSYEHDLVFCGIKESTQSQIKSADVIEVDKHKITVHTDDTNMKWGVYDYNFNLIVAAELDKKPIPYNKGISKWYTSHSQYYLLKKQEKYGLLCEDGRLIANIELTKEQAVALLEIIS